MATSEDDIVGTVPFNHPMVPAAGIHRYAVVGQSGEVLVVKRGNSMTDALTYRTRLGAVKAAGRYGTGRVVDRQAKDG